MTRLLFEDPHHRIELHRSEGNSRGLVYTFTPFMFSNLENEGFGVSFLCGLGFDVVAFKCNNDSWYQNLTSETLDQVFKLSDDYDFVATYGSSMGGYAAIAFSQSCCANLVLAISPQYTIQDDRDKRWKPQGDKITWQRRINKTTAAAECFVVIYDDHLKKDKLQVSLILENSSFKDVHEVKLPFSGHPAGHFLVQAGQLTNVISSILNGTYMIDVKYKWSYLRRSDSFLRSLGEYCLENNRGSLARLCFEKLISLHPENGYFAYSLSRAQVVEGDTEVALVWANKALELAPNHPPFAAHRNQLLA